MRPFWPFLELLSRGQSADVRGAGTHDKPLRTFAWETKSNRDLTKFSWLTFMPSVISRNVFRWSYAEVCGQVRLPVVWRIRLQNELILHEIFLQILKAFLNHFSIILWGEILCWSLINWNDMNESHTSAISQNFQNSPCNLPW